MAGQIECYGYNRFGQANPPVDTFARISVGHDVTCGVLKDSSIQCWGNEDSPVVTRTPTPYGFGQIDVGRNHACALWRGKAICWGDDEFGQSSPPAGPFEQIATGYSHSCAIQTNGLVTCWGHDGSKESSGHPQQIKFTEITAGDAFTCGLTIQRRALCWGRSREGQLKAPKDAFFSAISAGKSHACAVRDASRGVDSVVCWGANHMGQAHPRSKGHFVAVTSGAAHSCALTNTGAVRCWGSNSDGQSNGRWVGK